MRVYMILAFIVYGNLLENHTFQNICILQYFFEQVSSYPGQDVPIKLKAYDELNHTSAAVFQISLNESKVIE